jgi:hypothetical protein
VETAVAIVGLVWASYWALVCFDLAGGFRFHRIRPSPLIPALAPSSHCTSSVRCRVKKIGRIFLEFAEIHRDRSGLRFRNRWFLNLNLEKFENSKKI